MMSYDIAEYVSGWRFNGLHDDDKWRICLKPFSYGEPMRRSKLTSTHTYTHTHIYIYIFLKMQENCIFFFFNNVNNTGFDQ